MIQLKSSYPWVDFWAENDTYHLDVREVLEQGGEPYAAIMECVQQVTNGDTLVVHALFEPKPLVAQLGRMGLNVRTDKLDLEHWTVSVTHP